MAYKYQYNPAATDNVSLQDTARGRAVAGSLTYRSTNSRMRRTEDEEASLGTICCFGFLFSVAQIFLHAALTLVLFWICYFRWDQNKYPTPFLWRGEGEKLDNQSPEERYRQTKEDLKMTWNLHPFLMVAGFIYFMGQAMLVYRIGTCCRRLITKLVHTTFHLLAIPCIALGFLAVWDYKSLQPAEDGSSAPQPHFYSIHSWLGLATMGLFALQLLVGLFSFLMLLACESGTARFRAGLVPVHAIMGTVTFLLAIATALCGLTEVETGVSKNDYPSYITRLDRLDITESVPLFLNVISGSLGVLAIIIPLILWYPKFRFRTEIA